MRRVLGRVLAELADIGRPDAGQLPLAAE